MDKLPIEVIRKYMNMIILMQSNLIVLKQLTAHCYIWNGSICLKPYNECCCYCIVCKTYLKFCHQIYYDKGSTYEDELADFIQLGF